MAPHNPPGILIASSRANRGAGGETYLLRILQNLDRARYRPVVVLPGEGDLIEDCHRLEVDCHVVDSEYGWLRQPVPWNRFLSDTRNRVEQTLGIIEREHIDLVHTNSNHRLDAALAARLAGVHHIYLAHIEYQRELPLFQRMPLTRASYASLMGELSSLAVAVSRSVADTLSPGTPEEKLQVIHNGLDLQELDASAAGGDIRGELGLAPDSILVSAVGRLHPDKGFDIYIEAASRVLSAGSDCHFLLIGGDEVQAHADDLRTQVRDLGIAERFHCVGFRRDVPRLLRQSDLFVLSSRREGHPFVLLESMGCGCAAVASRCAGVDETLVEGETGYAVGIGDAEAMAQAITRLVTDSGARTRMGAAARRHVERHFQAADMVARLMDAYDRVLAGPGCRAGSPALELFLDTAGELGRMGLELEGVKERLRKLEGQVEPLVSNPLTRALKGLRGLVRKGG